jgi:hypothetical protein
MEGVSIMRTKVIIALVFTALLLSLAIVPAAMASDPEPGTAPAASSFATSASSSLAPVVTENGKITLSLDAAGNNSASSTIQVEKPSAAATVRSAYMMAATVYGGGQISDGDVTIDGDNITWDVETSNVLSSYNYWTDATALVKAKIDAAAAGRVDFTIVEVNRNSYIDGEILAVIFDDPAQIVSNTVILCFGSQAQGGDTFAIGLAEPIDKSDPNLVLDFSLGISYSYQAYDWGQHSNVDVNGTRLTDYAGGEDDGGSYNGGLITVGGLDDVNTNPLPSGASEGSYYRTDDELYSLLPFVEDGDTSITVETENPSYDDNMMFAALFLGGATAVVGEGIVLSPAEAVNPVGAPHTVTAKVQDDTGAPVVGVTVTFTVTAGPNAGVTDTAVTDANGEATFTYVSALEGTDTIQACFSPVMVVSTTEVPMICSNEVTKTWQGNVPPIPELSTMVLFGIGLLMLGGLIVLVRRKPSAA